MKNIKKTIKVLLVSTFFLQASSVMCMENFKSLLTRVFNSDKNKKPELNENQKKLKAEVKKYITEKKKESDKKWKEESEKKYEKLLEATYSNKKNKIEALNSFLYETNLRKRCFEDTFWNYDENPLEPLDRRLIRVFNKYKFENLEDFKEKIPVMFNGLVMFNCEVIGNISAPRPTIITDLAEKELKKLENEK